MERRGKSSPAHRRLCGHVNPIRSNTDRMQKCASAGRISEGWLELTGNRKPRQITALNDRTRLTGSLVIVKVKLHKSFDQTFTKVCGVGQSLINSVVLALTVNCPTVRPKILVNT